MKKTLFITPRQVGKTTKIVYEYMKKPKECMVIVHSGNMITHLRKMLQDANHKLNHMPENVFDQDATIENLIWYCQSHYITKIFLDEYMNFSPKNMDKINMLIHRFDEIEVIAFSTADRLYNKNIFDMVCKYKTAYDFLPKFLTHNRVRTSIGMFAYDNTKENMNQIKDLWVNMITDPNTNVIRTDFGTQMWQKHKNPEKLKNLHSDEEFQISVLGKLTKHIETRIVTTYE